MLINNTNYNYSYVLFENSLDYKIKNQNFIEIDNWFLHFSNDLDIEIFENENEKFILLGYALDIRNSSLNTNQILSNLSEVENLDQSLDYINGRYILIVNKDKDITLYTDASALLPINYSSDKRIIASHDIIIKDLLNNFGADVKPIENALKGSFDFTRYRDIFKFNPSLKLNLTTKKFIRYYPKSQIITRDIDKIVSELEIYFSEMIKWLKNWDNEIILTLTGGYDSRVSMALTREINERIEYITYLHPNLSRLSKRAQEIYDIDLYVTKTLSENMNIRHTLINLADFDLKGDEREYFKKVLQSTHSFPLIDYFKNKRKFNKVLHIKSTVFGMGKSDFSLKKNHNPETFNEMTEFIHGVSKEAKVLPEYQSIIKEYMQRNLQVKNVGGGRHYFEMFHLESRMGNWHSNVTQETDPELLDFIFVNTRRIIDLLQSPSIQERKDKILYKTLINKYWPALLFIGVNEKTINVDYDKIGLNNQYINGLKIYELNNLELERNSDNVFTIKPDSGFVGPQYQYVFKTTNNTHEPKALHLKSFFNKENARKYINVKIMKLDNKTYKSIDIVDLFNGYDVTLEPFQKLMIRIDYNNVFDKESWQQAGRIQISNV